jgi:hypothetical protein
VLTGIVAAVVVSAGACSSTPDTAAPATAPTTTAATTIAPSTAPAGAASIPPSGAGPTIVKETIAAKLGQTFSIRVDVDPTKEARWQVDDADPAMVFYLGEEPDTASTTPGAPLADVLLFRAEKIGTTTIVLRFGAPGVAAPTDKRKSFTVNVTG